MPRLKGPPNPIDMHVGSRVRQRRMELGLSQEKLAGKIGLTFQQIQKYEKGTNRIGASRLQQIADVLAVPPNWFFHATAGIEYGENIGAAEIAVIDSFVTSTDGLRLCRAFMRLPIATQRALVRVVQGFADGNFDDEHEPPIAAIKKRALPRARGRATQGLGTGSAKASRRNA